MKPAVTVTGALLLLLGGACSTSDSKPGVTGGAGMFGPAGNGTLPGGSGAPGHAGIPATGGMPAAGGMPGTAGAGGAIVIMDAGTVDGGSGFAGAPDPAGGAGGAPPPPPPGNYAAVPAIPPVAGDCPAFVSGTISFMGLGGIRMEVGPKAPGPTAPMLFYWHGTGSFSGEFSFLAAPVAQGITSQGGVVVSFQGTSGGGGCFCSGTSIFCMSDMDIADQFLACAVRDHNVDPHRIFTMGCSAGGLFATCMAAARSNYIAAAAPNSGGFPVLAQAFNTDYTPALMTVHGAPGVDVVAIDFSQSSAIADETFKSRGGFVINCNHGGGHCGGGVVAAQVWEFFQAHPYGVNPYPWAGGLPPSFPAYCTIY